MISNFNNSYTNSSTNNGVDWLTILLYALLVIFGWLNLYAANFNPETKVFFSVDAEYFKQLMWVVITTVLAGVVMMADSKMFVEFANILYVFSLLVLASTLVIGKEVNGAKAWLAFGSVQFQPVELAKISTALLVSRVMSRYGFKFTLRNYIKLFTILLIPIVLVLLQNDTGSALIFMVLILSMYREGLTSHILCLGAVALVGAIASLLIENWIVMATCLFIAVLVVSFYLYYIAQKKKVTFTVLVTVIPPAIAALTFYLLQKPVRLDLLVAIGAASLSVYLLYLAISKRIQYLTFVIMYLWMGLIISFATSYIFNNVLIEHQRTRINVLFGLEEDLLGAGYNVNQSLIAIGSGNLTGKGFLEGTQTKLNFVPKQSTDFIFCTVGEEWGFLGCTFLIALYIAFFLRIMHLAEKQHSVFSRVYGYCIVCIFFFHFAVNICMTIGLMPVIGIPLPFFSYGGSSFLGFSLMLFLFLRLDKDRQVLIR
ncbi:MAG: rod shape-determining protein RodA [Bacteroidales bacterium]|nr:rod shape-determining protein RodA [Bacteroidales bacterium]